MTKWAVSKRRGLSVGMTNDIRKVVGQDEKNPANW
jgi:hypothetical protein